MFGANPKITWLNNLSQVFRGEMAESAEQLQDLWEGKTRSSVRSPITRCRGCGAHPMQFSVCWVVIRTTGAWCCSSLVTSRLARRQRPI